MCGFQHFIARPVGAGCLEIKGRTVSPVLWFFPADARVPSFHSELHQSPKHTALQVPSNPVLWDVRIPRSRWMETFQCVMGTSFAFMDTLMSGYEI